ncbi:MAG: ATP-binding cassette domain-containing protein [Rhodospirillaceae bacterium]
MTEQDYTGPLVETNGLKHAYQDANTSKTVLHGIDLTIDPGSAVFLTGFSGSGKTTLISLIGCLRSVQEGSLKLLGEELNGASATKLRNMRRRIGYVFQHFNLLDFMTIRQNVQQSLELQADFSPKEAKRRSEEMLDMVGLGGRFNDYPSALSGGQKQRVAVARALVHRPSLVLADEPTAALDTGTGREIIDRFSALIKHHNSAALVVTHNMRILDAADYIYHMEDGRLSDAVGEQLSLTLPTLSDLQLRNVADETTKREFKPGDIVVKQDDEANEFYIMLAGAVEVVRENPDGTEQFLAKLDERGKSFGEIGLLQAHAKRTATIRALGPDGAEVLVISKETFKDMVAESWQTKAILKDQMARHLMSYKDKAS